ncbi:hypothetical protein SAMN06265222_1011075 [Neorhodopirellula lusitana]|uniref:Uncharacterized protein n=1 Tax=Neorhodopirellula lusitana TaxID=445327 RepID=A0ABY1PTN7_9BACT|nr:hypothetical protein [Neorhodopirellula lusitana]SMP44078.1 hypothetical protein SAMN06265222_1011075 [Neorhodopirellula lusitana]
MFVKLATTTKTKTVSLLARCCGFVGMAMLGSLLLSSGAASAQGYSNGGLQVGGATKPEFAPLPPALSPYLDLLRSDSGVVSPYHSFVLPRRQITQQQSQQSAQIHRLQSQVHQLDAVSQQRRRVSRSRMPTGNGGFFQQYSHFYPASNNPSRR